VQRSIVTLEDKKLRWSQIVQDMGPTGIPESLKTFDTILEEALDIQDNLENPNTMPWAS